MDKTEKKVNVFGWYNRNNSSRSPSFHNCKHCSKHCLCSQLDEAFEVLGGCTIAALRATVSNEVDSPYKVDSSLI